MRNIYQAVSVVLFSGLLVAAWITHDTGVKINDPEQNIFIPDQLTTTLQVKASYDKEKIFFRYRWPAERPSIFHDVLVYKDGKWVKRGGDAVGPDPDFLIEDRVAMMIDDGSVPLFSRYGGYITIGDKLTTFTSAPESKEERTKYLPDTRTDPNDFEAVKSESDLETLRRAGYFIDLWQWRANRSNPVNLGDDGLVAEARSGDEGTGPYAKNWDKTLKQPKFMFDPARTGQMALKIDDILSGKFGFDDNYFLSPDTAVAFNPDADWQNGDTLPRRVLRAESGSRGDVAVAGEARWKEGFWDVTLVRNLDTGNTLDDKIFKDKGSYDLAFAVFKNASSMRWHYVSLPISLGLETDAQLVAKRFSDPKPNWNQDWTEIKMFYPGQVNWGRLTDPKSHAGADKIAQRVPVAYRHSEEQLAIYSVEVEFADQIYKNWLLTLLASLGLIVALGINSNLLMTRKEK
ncbi:MAG: ethylbenzene dehydrogenase-related protein [Rhizobiaceae bacterium]|nr:ethylbenzene dehydrogenase-related protein [Rhizobiaceae bacterium]